MTEQKPWIEPVKRITESGSLQYFAQSKAYYNLNNDLSTILNLIKGVDCPLHSFPVSKQSTSTVPNQPTSISLQLSPPIYQETPGNHTKIIDLFGTLNSWIDDIPPLKISRRFGNLSCREWHTRLESSLMDLLHEAISPIYPASNEATCDDFLIEASHYFKNSFGSKIRLDYGTGHELSFLAFFGALIRYNCLTDMSGAHALSIWCQYYNLVRRLIVVYTLEPAGSHGVWGLDDHFHLIYILGAAQFNEPDCDITVTSNQMHITKHRSKNVPLVSSILSPITISQYKDKNLYINALSFINDIKKGPFNEHSPMLYDITRSVRLWVKVLSGMIKMYKVEVLGKFPVVQHFYFGNWLFPWESLDGKLLPVTAVQSEDSNELKPNAASADFSGATIAPQIPTSMPKLDVKKHPSFGTMKTGAPWAKNGKHASQSRDIENGLKILRN